MFVHIASRQFWVAGINSGRASSASSVRDWIIDGKWSLNLAVTKKVAVLSPHVYMQLVDAQFGEALKLACAAFESARAVPVYRSEIRSCAWQFISYYYSAYFSANALMRLCGYGCVNLTALECAEINQYALLCGLGGTDDKSKLAPGMYYCTTSRKGGDTWTLTSINVKGGVHIQFWNGFLRYLKDLQAATNTSGMTSTEKAAALSEMTDLLDGLNHSGAHNGNWLSEIRNALNYRLEYGLWHPYSGSQADGNFLRGIIRSGLNGGAALPKVSQALSDIERAAKVSAFLLGWLYESLRVLASSSTPSKKEQIQAGPLAIATTV